MIGLMLFSLGSVLTYTSYEIGRVSGLLAGIPMMLVAIMLILCEISDKARNWFERHKRLFVGQEKEASRFWQFVVWVLEPSNSAHLYSDGFLGSAHARGLTIFTLVLGSTLLVSSLTVGLFRFVQKLSP